MKKKLSFAAAALLALLAAAPSASAKALVTQGSSELGVSGFVDIESALGTDVQFDLRYAYFFFDRFSFGVIGGFGDNDAVTRFDLSLVSEYNFALSDSYRPLVGTDFVPFLGVGVGFLYADLYPGDETAVLFSGEAGAKFFLSDSAAVTLSLLGQFATEDVFADDAKATDVDLSLRLGMRFYF